MHRALSVRPSGTHLQPPLALALPLPCPCPALCVSFVHMQRQVRVRVAVAELLQALSSRRGAAVFEACRDRVLASIQEHFVSGSHLVGSV